MGAYKMIMIDMEMPASCRDCRMIDEEFGYCHGIDISNQIGMNHVSFEAWDHSKANTKPSWCPLIEVKDESKGNN